MTTSTVTQNVARVVSNANSTATVAQNVARVVSNANSAAQVAQQVVRVVSTNLPDVAASANTGNFLQFF